MNISVNTKLQVLILPLLGALLTLSLLTINENWRNNNKVQEIQQMIRLTAQSSELVHELQKERGATAGFIGSSGTNFGETLNSQRKQTDVKMASLRTFLQDSETGINNNQVNSLVSSANNALKNISSIRSRVQQLSIPASEAIAYYTAINHTLIQIASLISKDSPDTDISSGLNAYYNYLEGKERAGIERAVLSGAFGNKGFQEGMYAKFIGLMTEQNTYFGNFKLFSTSDLVSQYEIAMGDDSIGKVENFRKLALNQNMEQDSEDWFKQATLRINQLKTIEDSLTTNIVTMASEFSNKATQALWMSASLAFVMLVFASVLSWYLITNLTRQVAIVVKAISQAADNNDLSVRSKTIVHDEIGMVSDRLNAMLVTFSNTVNDIGSASDQLASASEETSSVVKENAKQLEKQQENTLLVVAGVEQLSASIKEVAQNVLETSEMTEQASDNVDIGVSAVTESVTNIQHVASQVQNTAKTISTLNDQSQNISKVLEVIKGIAEQTNLLALNAAIEAARAGEQGRGFAVVADEVRSLAKKTQDSTGEIEIIVTDFLQETSSAFTQMQQNETNVQESVGVVKKVQVALDNIMVNINSVRDKATQIAAAAEEQVAVGNEIAAQVQEVGDQSQAAATGAIEISKAADEQAGLAIKLKELASKFKI